MPSPTHIYEPLSSENAALVLIDHQVGLMSGVRDYSIAELKHNVVGLAKAAKALKLPIVDGPGQHVDRRFLNLSKLCQGCKSSTVRLSTLSMMHKSHVLSKRPAERN